MVTGAPSRPTPSSRNALPISTRHARDLSHSVHLSARCVYVLVWSPRKEEDESSRDTADGIVQPMFEWLQILSSHVPDA